jgi:stalled ribosome rescue protein Dom34
MDYSIAHLIEFSENPIEIKTIESKFSSKEKGNGLAIGENHMHSRERQYKNDYFKQITNELLVFDKILLFGPTHAKNELYNQLIEDNRFSNSKIYQKETSKMSLNQRNKFINDYFVSPLYM